MKELTLKQIADWCGGTVAPEYETVPVTGVEPQSGSEPINYLNRTPAR